MADPQKENGFTPIANEILDAVISRKWTQHQLKILMVVWRFSYGFSKKKASFNYMKDFDSYGVRPDKIAKSLHELEKMKVLSVDWDKGDITFLKDHDCWSNSFCKQLSMDSHKDLVALNINPVKSDKTGWSRNQRGGGRKQLRFSKREPKKGGLGSPNENLNDELGCQKGNLNDELGCQKGNLNDELGCQKGNLNHTQPRVPVDQKGALKQSFKERDLKQPFKTIPEKPFSPGPDGAGFQSFAEGGWWRDADDMRKDMIEYLLGAMKKTEGEYLQLDVIDGIKTLVRDNDPRLIQQVHTDFMKKDPKQISDMWKYFKGMVRKYKSNIPTGGGIS